MATRLVLASTSFYRRQLLAKLGLEFEAVAPGVAETPLDGEPPASLALRLAEEKAHAVARCRPDSLVIGSDQVAFLDEEIVSKPGTRANAILQLQRASGRTVRFYTALCVVNTATGQTRTDLDVCAVVFRHLEPGQIERYVDRDLPFDSAGGFKAEGLGIALFERIDGEDPNALIGLPLIRLVRILESFGVEIP